MFKSLTAVLLCLHLALAAPAHAADQPAQTAAQLQAALKFQDGKITLPGNIATVDLPAAFRYLSPEDANRVLVEGWGNPPGFHTLGMIVPADVSPMSDAGWGVVLTYDKDGHVKDDDADSIKYDELLKTMQEGVAEDNAERKKQGYPGMTLVGWAEPPSYDKSHHKLYWAKELKTDGSQQNSLNYNIRVLGREGVLVLNAVAGMAQIGQIKTTMPQVTAVTDFTPGNRYADFDSKTDKVAEYGLAALVAGGVAAKMGLFGKLFALLIAFKKLIVVAVLGVGAAIGKFFKRDKPVNLDKAD
jgi:uncharacterized membrane-anchored protein